MRIEITGWFVRNQKRRPVDQGAGDRCSLLLAAAQLVDKMLRALAQPDEVDHFLRAFFALRRRHALEEKGQGNIFPHVHCRQQIEELKNETDPTAAELRQRCVIRGMQRDTVDENFAAGRPIEPGEEMDERALAATARAPDRHELITRDLERNAIQRVHGPLPARIFASQIFQRDQASFIRQRAAPRKPRRLSDRRGKG